MTFSYYVNNTITNFGDVFYQMKELLKTAGWAVQSSSDGLTYNASGDIITSGGTGAGGMTNTNAWYVLAHPTLDGYQRYICLQVGTSKNTIRFKISWTPFNGGSPGILRVPSASDERLLYGYGTDAAPGFSALLDSTAANVRVNLIAGDVTEGYAYFMLFHKVGAGTLGGAIIMEKLVSLVGDIDPYFYYIQGTGTFPYDDLNGYKSHDFTSTGTYCPQGWIRKSFSNAIFVKCITSWYSTGIKTSNFHGVGQLGSDPYDGTDVVLPLILYSPISQSGLASYKGQSINMKLNGSSKTALDTSNTRTRIYSGPFSFPWNGSVPSI